MSEAVLYRNSSGKDVTHASYSSRQTFRHCPREFQLTRIEGWSDKTQRAATLFGRCIEAGLQAYEESGRIHNTGVHSFEKQWNDVKLVPDFEKLEYTDAEKDWDTLLRTGREMMMLYEVRAPRLPLSTKPGMLFQQPLRKKIFPGTNLDRIENKAIIDVLSFPRWDHPLLPVIPEDEAKKDLGVAYHVPSEHRPLIIDVKTSGKDLAVDLVMLDPQLAEYAWQSRIPDVAFLWFVKKSHGLKKGSKVSLLQPWRDKFAGWEGVVIDVCDVGIYIGDFATLANYETAVKELRGKARAAAEGIFFEAGRHDGTVLLVPENVITKQRIQFGAARFTENEMDDTGKSVAQTTVEMVRAHELEFYEKQPGIRFPNEKCNFCAMRWICLNRPDERDKTLTRRGEEWLDGVQDEGND